MRGIVAAGMVSKLTERGYKSCFDVVYGASSGACVGAYFLSNQTEEGKKIYTEDICHREYIDARRIFKRPAIVETKRIVHEIIKKKRALDTDHFVKPGNRLAVLTTDVPTGKTIAHQTFTDEQNLFQALNASLCVPGPREPGIQIEGRPQLDGAISDPLSLKLALKSNCTHLLVLATKRSKDFTGSKSGLLCLESMSLGLMYNRRLGIAYYRSRNKLTIEKIRDTGKPVTDVVVRGENSIRCKWNSFDSTLLNQAFQEGADEVETYLKR